MNTLIHKTITPGEYSNKDLQKASFTNEDLSGVDFSGSDLRGADLSGSNLAGADFSNVRTGITPVIVVWLFLISLASFVALGLYCHAHRSNDSDVVEIGRSASRGGRDNRYCAVCSFYCLCLGERRRCCYQESYYSSFRCRFDYWTRGLLYRCRYREGYGVSRPY